MRTSCPTNSTRKWFVLALAALWLKAFVVLGREQEITLEFMQLIDTSMTLSEQAFLISENDFFDNVNGALDIADQLKDLAPFDIQQLDLTGFGSVERKKDELGLDELSVFGGRLGQLGVNFNLVAKYRGTCFGVFRGTFINPFDNLQNANVVPTRVGGCIVHSGLANNYLDTNKEAFDEALETCIKSCIGDCPLVFTGISQGGGTAVIAQLLWQKYDPTVITFGAPGAVYPIEECSKINERKNFRFWAVTVSPIGNQVNYDMIVNSNLLGKHYGHAYLLFPDQLPVYLGLNYNERRLPENFSAHTVYRNRIPAILDNPDIVYPLTPEKMKLPAGATCGYDDECQSDCNFKKQCSGDGTEGGSAGALVGDFVGEVDGQIEGDCARLSGCLRDAIRSPFALDNIPAEINCLPGVTVSKLSELFTCQLLAFAPSVGLDTDEICDLVDKLFMNDSERQLRFSQARRSGAERKVSTCR